MLAIEVEFLTGRYVATRHHDRERAEWPPHPVRLAYALVAAAGAERSVEEEAALEWLCAQAPPAIACGDAWPRTTVTSYVPVNDRAALDARTAVGTIPRLRQPRTFPSVVPESPTVTYIWRDSEPPAAIRATLSTLVSRLVYLGHSSSLVRAALVDQPPPAAFVPASGGRMLRVAAEGLVLALDEALARYEATGVRGPLPTDYASYRAAGPLPAPRPVSALGEIVALRAVGAQRLPLASLEHVTTRLRAAVLQLVPDPVPPEISGHDHNGSPLERPHVAYIALPDVGHRHAGGSLLGVALVLPRNLADETRSALLAALANLSVLRISRSVAWALEPARIEPDSPLPRALRPDTWTHPSRRYATATPIELDRYVDDRLGTEAEAIVAGSAEHIGLPRPVRVRLSPVSAFEGGGHVHDVRRLRDRPRRPLVHAILDFQEEIEGPVLLGSGRYRGLGVCRPMTER